MAKITAINTTRSCTSFMRAPPAKVVWDTPASPGRRLANGESVQARGRGKRELNRAGSARQTRGPQGKLPGAAKGGRPRWPGEESDVRKRAQQPGKSARNRVAGNPACQPTRGSCQPGIGTFRCRAGRGAITRFRGKSIPDPRLKFQAAAGRGKGACKGQPRQSEQRQSKQAMESHDHECALTTGQPPIRPEGAVSGPGFGERPNDPMAQPSARRSHFAGANT